MAKFGALDKRMKEYYENISKTKLIRRTPVALRIDGKAFHTFTRGFKKPFDDILVSAMQNTMRYLCANIQGCVFGYTQSDEITLILVDYQTLTTSAWFDYEVQKMCSIAASMATMYFNKTFTELAHRYIDTTLEDSEEMGEQLDAETGKYIHTLDKAIEEGAMFDCRAFNIPKEEVCNLIFWRQQDASKNSVQMVARCYFSQKELNGKNTNQMQDMLHETYDINWNDFPTEKKRGSSCIKSEKGWIIDHEMPILKNEDRAYVEKLIYIETEQKG